VRPETRPPKIEGAGAIAQRGPAIDTTRKRPGRIAVYGIV
jgi:hypothetical protein